MTIIKIDSDKGEKAKWNAISEMVQRICGLVLLIYVVNWGTAHTFTTNVWIGIILAVVMML